MPFHSRFQSIVALIAGVLILLYPGLLATIVAIYLIVIGILGLLGKRL
jgi:UPF0716 family protein affecting phage T7 exclusion